MVAAKSRQQAYDAPAIVIGLDSLTGLQTARLLAARQVPVLAVAKNPANYCCWTRCCKRPAKVDTDSADLISYLEQLGPQLKTKGVLFPCTDLSVLQISEHRERLSPWFHVALAEHATVQRLLNKAKFVEFAQEHDIPIPRSRVLRDAFDAASAAEDLAFPCAIKPAVKSLLWQKHVAQKAVIVRNAEELHARYAELSRWADELVVQEWIDGPITNQFTCNGYFDAGSRPLVTFVTRKLRQWPMEAGIGCLSEECRDQEVLDATLRLFERAAFQGLGYLEMKRDQRDGRCYVVEPNIGRPTGRSAAAEAGGVELMMTAYCDALGLPLPDARTQQYTNVKWIHRRRDLQASWKLWCRGELTIAQWRQSLRGRKVDAVFQWNDWRPFAGDLWRTLGKSWKKRSAPREDGARQVPKTESIRTAARVA